MIKKIIRFTSYISLVIVMLFIVGTVFTVLYGKYNTVAGKSCRDTVYRKVNLNKALTKSLWLKPKIKGYEAVISPNTDDDGEGYFRVVTNFLPEKDAPYLLWKIIDNKYVYIDKLELTNFGVWQGAFDGCHYWNENEPLVITSHVLPIISSGESSVIDKKEIIFEGIY